LLRSGLRCACAALESAARKPGLWEIKMAMEGRTCRFPASQHCIDAETDKLMSFDRRQHAEGSVLEAGRAEDR